MGHLQTIQSKGLSGKSISLVVFRSLVQISARFSALAKMSDPQKIEKRGSGKWGGVEVYTLPSIQAHFRLAFD